VTVNKAVVAGAAVAAVGAGALVIGTYYVPWQTAAAWASGDEERASMLADCAFSLCEYARLFALMILGGLALMAYASGPATS
jgi:hypothetical protein